MQESPEPPASQQLSDETLRKAAETASEPSGPAWPTPEPQRAPINQGWGEGGGVQPEESDGFDPRLVLYVTVPALVLAGQLFFTFSRDAFVGTDNVGAANMEINPPGLERLK